MVKTNRIKTALYSMAIGTSLGFFTTTQGAELKLSDTPLFLTGQAPPLVLLVMGKNHKLYYEAYNDASDLDGDGTIETGYEPTKIDYYGYFDSYKCYSYNSDLFEPTGTTTDKKCASGWSGDFLNYLTTSRMDALRKVLYGGHRDIDTASKTVLAGTFIPQDAHSWGKEYAGIAVDGFDISDYTPLSLPSSGQHLFAVTSLSDGAIPVLRVLKNKNHRIWEWASKEAPVVDGSLGSPTDYKIRVRVCDSSMLEKNCQQYGSSSYKPVGLLQEYGENDSMYFGLLTGTYPNNMSGGVLRKTVGTITDEINPNTGAFTNTNGIISTIDNLRIINFNYSSDHYAAGWITDRPMKEGEAQNWGNPIAEMMYEGLRYFAGKGSPTSAFSISSPELGLPVANWDDPYAASSGFPTCSKPFQIVISGLTPSYDTDQVPGSYFSSFTGDISRLNCQALADTISSHEPEVAGLHFIGQSGTDADGTPSAKTVTSLGNIRGLAPEEPTKRGGYYSASIAYYGHKTDLNSAQGEQKMSAFAVALGSPLPKIEIPVNGQTITLVPFAKTVGPASGCVDGVDPSQGAFQPTDQIVDFYVENLTPTSGTFRINYEDVEQGADHDMDAIAIYEYQVQSKGTVDITLTSTYASGCLIQHMGYVISGTTEDGVYLEIRDKDGDQDGNPDNNPDYFLDTPPGATPGNGWNDGNPLPLSTTRAFTPGNTSAATLLKSPLWYATKWGSFQDKNGDNIPQGTEWDTNNDSTPDNYFLVTNALTLEEQLTKAFEEIAARNASNGSVTLNTGSISADSYLYQARFNSGTWSGQLLRFHINSDGSLDPSSWDAAEKLDNTSSNLRDIVTYKPSTGKGIPFRWPADPANPTSTELDVSQSEALSIDPATGTPDSKGKQRLKYIRGKEITGFRPRVHKLGDIVNSAPVYVGTTPAFRYPDSLETIPYSTFKSSTTRDAMIYVGANDGMLHAFDAVTGKERFAYVPNAIIKNLNQLTNPNYSHRYYVDGTPTVVDAFFGGAWHTLLAGGLRGGGQAIYTLDVTTSPSANEGTIADKILWEFTDKEDADNKDKGDTGDEDLGYTFSDPNIIRMYNGEWAVVFGNGYNNTDPDGSHSTTGNAVLYIVEAKTGELIKKIDTGRGLADDPNGTAPNRPNGLATVAPIDADGDSIVDYIYAGDLFGNLWKFDVSSSNEKQWEVTCNGKPLFTAVAANGSYQPITTRPQVGRHPTDSNSFMVYFGTGKYLEDGDDKQTNQTTQTFYGIWDKNDGSCATNTITRTDLLEQQIIKEVTQSFDTNNDGSADTSYQFRVTTDKSTDWSKHKGWRLDLINTEDGNTNNYGEIQVSNPLLRNGRIIFTTTIPSDKLCDFGGTGWLMELDAASGARLPYTPFDLNLDKDFDQIDYIIINVDTDGDGDKESVSIPASGKKSKIGILTTPGIIAISPQREVKYFSGSTGEVGLTYENAGPGYSGRLSWIQLR